MLLYDQVTSRHCLGILQEMTALISWFRTPARHSPTKMRDVIHRTVQLIFLRIFPESLPPFYDKLLPYLSAVFQTGWWSWILVWVFALDNKSFKIELFVWKILWVPLKKQRNDQNSIPQASLAGLCCAEVSFILRTGIRWRTLQTVDTLKKEMLTVPLSL